MAPLHVWEHAQSSQVMVIGTRGYRCCSEWTNAKGGSRFNPVKKCALAEISSFRERCDFKSTLPRSRGAERRAGHRGCSGKVEENPSQGVREDRRHTDHHGTGCASEDRTGQAMQR